MATKHNQCNRKAFFDRNFPSVSFNQRCWLWSVRIQSSECTLRVTDCLKLLVMANINTADHLSWQVTCHSGSKLTHGVGHILKRLKHVGIMVHFDEDPTTFDLPNPEQLVECSFLALNALGQAGTMLPKYLVALLRLRQWELWLMREVQMLWQP